MSVHLIQQALGRDLTWELHLLGHGLGTQYLPLGSLFL